MITYTVYKTYSNGKIYFEARGLSTDDKPKTNTSNGSLFIEINTGDFYMFDETGNTWRKQ